MPIQKERNSSLQWIEINVNYLCTAYLCVNVITPLKIDLWREKKSQSSSQFLISFQIIANIHCNTRTQTIDFKTRSQVLCYLCSQSKQARVNIIHEQPIQYIVLFQSITRTQFDCIYFFSEFLYFTKIAAPGQS